MLTYPKRYKTRPTPQKSPILDHFWPAGRKLSRSRHKHPKQGDFSLAVGSTNRSWATCVAPPAAISLTERFIFIATTCLGHGKLALALTRRSRPPCAWRLGCSERNIAPAWDCFCRHEKLIAPARLKSLILPLFRRAGVVFLSRRPSNTQHSGALGRCFFHYQAAAPTHIAQNNASGGNKKRHAEQAHKTGPVIIHRPRLICISARSACINARGYQARTERS